ncbi:hypothetical protein VTK26DRAFT_5347 [Humicola hyalothermophila]
MSTTTRRVPLSSNPNAANSPMRASSVAALQGTKKSRSHADMLREEAYGQPPPAKRLMIDRGVASPTRVKTTRTVVHRSASRATGGASTTQKPSQASLPKATEKEIEMMQQWHTNTRAAFPKMVFYFESIPDEQRARLAKQVAQLGAREEKFFSIGITHVVTTRPIPPQKKPQDENEPAAEAQTTEEQPQTINPSLLSRDSALSASTAASARRKGIHDPSSSRKPGLQSHDDPIRRPKTRSTDVLDRAREMGKKIWSLEKLQNILKYMLRPDSYTSAALGVSTRSASKANEQADLAKALEHERVYGPSDRDPTVSSRELFTFKGPYIYVYDMDERTKPIMVREYMKAPDPKDGMWPQFRATSNGRCPFVPDESYDALEMRHRDREREKARNKARAAKAAAAGDAAAGDAAAGDAAPDPKPSEVAATKPSASKRTLAEMEDGHNRGAAVGTRATESFDGSKASNPLSLAFRTQNAFMSYAKPGRLLAGEPVASGMQPSTVTSAIRSQMVSSTGGVLGAKAGTSKEIHGLQRRVILQKASTPAVSQEASHDGNTFVRSASLSRASHRKLDTVGEEEVASKPRERLRRTASVPVSQPKPKRDPKPGYCENCQDKFADFEEHIVSRTHRKFAENDENWAQVDALLAQLKRVPRY